MKQDILQHQLNYSFQDIDEAWKEGFDECKVKVLEIINSNKELESVSYSGKHIYKIYGNVVEKIEKL